MIIIVLCQTVKVIVGAEFPHCLTTYYCSHRLSEHPPPTQKLSLANRKKSKGETEIAVACQCFLPPESHFELCYQWTAVCLSACLFVLPPVRPAIYLFSTRMVLRRGRPCLLNTLVAREVFAR